MSYPKIDFSPVEGRTACENLFKFSRKESIVKRFISAQICEALCLIPDTEDEEDGYEPVPAEARPPWLPRTSSTSTAALYFPKGALIWAPWTTSRRRKSISRAI